MRTLAIALAVAAVAATAGALNAAAPNLALATNDRALGDGTVADGGADAHTSGAFTFAPVRVVNAADFGGEPGVDVAPDGTLYVHAPSGIGSGTGSYVYKSTDGGVTWSDCALTTGPGGGDSAMAIDASGRLALNDLYVGSNTFYTSDDACASWNPMPVTTTYPAGDRQWLENGFKDCQFVQGWNHLLTGLRVQVTDNCGLVWREVATGLFVDWNGALVRDGSGRSQNLYYFHSEGGAVKVAVGRIVPAVGGSSSIWSLKQVASPVSGHDPSQNFVAGAVDAAGNVHATWQYMVGSGASATTKIMYAYSTDLGISWSAPVVVESAGSNVFPWIDAGAPGRVNVVYYHADPVGNPNNVNGPWRVNLAQSTNFGASWTKAVATPTSIHNDVICTMGTGCSGDNRDLLDYFEVAHDANGYAVISFTKDTDATGAGNGSPRNAFVRQTAGPTLL